MSPSRQKYFRYHGSSMWPYFQEGDLLEIEPVGVERLQPGDCLLFADRHGQRVVHRLVEKGASLRTRGDARPRPDACSLRPEDVLGRVIARYRLGQCGRVSGGRRGLLIALVYRYAGRIDPDRQSRGGRLARGIRKASSTLLKPLWQLGRVRTLRIPGQGSLVVWQWGSHLVGRQDPASGQWQMPWPWRLFVRLPEAKKQG